mgnify:FL=1
MTENNKNNDLASLMAEFAKTIQEGKKVKLQEEDKKNKDFLQDLGVDLEENSLFTSSFISELSKLKKEISEIKVDDTEPEPIVEEVTQPVTLGDFFSELSKAKEQLDIKLEKIEQQEVPVEITRISNPESNPEVIVEAPKPKDIIEVSAEKITKQESYTNTFTDPIAKKTDPNIRAIQDKLKYLEQWLGKVSVAGPGSGSYWLNDLGDTDHQSIVDATDQQVLTFDAALGKWIAADSQGGGGGPRPD